MTSKNRIKNKLAKKQRRNHSRRQFLKNKTIVALVKDILEDGVDPRNVSKLEKRLPPVIDTNIRKGMEQAEGLTDYFPIRKKWLRYLLDKNHKPLGLVRVAVLSFLCNQAKRVNAESRNNGWFYCTIKKMDEELAIGHSTQDRAISSLVEEHYISIKRKGVPGLRYFRINWTLIKVMTYVLETEEKNFNQTL